MSFHDKKINKIFYNWLLFSFLLVFIMVVIGGLTRLTNSGLSITEWELFKGILPPLSKQDWDRYFQLYKEIPQYKLIFNTMNINEFKIIFYWEYTHRVLGRIIGIVFLIPLIFFILQRKVSKEYLFNCILIMTLICIQGVVGWYMVKSGLVNNISVSHYRLSVHLVIAFIIISMIFWLILNLKYKTKKKFLDFKFNNYPYFFLILILFIQITIGAFVSGLDAGHIYQTWPRMNHTYFPDDVEIKSLKDFFNFNSHSLVQFYHRNMAYLISIYILLFGFYIFRNSLNHLFKSYLIVLIFLLLQIVIGITTLISGLNIYFASLHQIFSLILILSVINLYYRSIN